MAASPNASSPSRSGSPRPGKGKSRLSVLFWLILFGAGFYCGVSTTKWAVTGPDFARKILGLDTSTLKSQPNLTSVPIQQSPPPAQPTNSAPTTAPTAGTGAPSQTGSTAPTAPTTTPGSTVPPTNTDAGTTADKSTTGTPPAIADTTPKKPAAPPITIPKDLPGQIKVYNALLRDLQLQVSRQYASEIGNSEGTATDPHLTPEQIDTMRTTIQQAQSLYDTIAADPHFAQHYTEKEEALPPTVIPPALAVLNADNLHFIRQK